MPASAPGQRSAPLVLRRAEQDLALAGRCAAACAGRPAPRRRAAPPAARRCSSNQALRFGKSAQSMPWFCHERSHGKIAMSAIVYSSPATNGARLQALVEHAVEALGLVAVAIDRVGDLLRRVHAEVMRLAEHRADAAHLEHQPLERACSGRAGRRAGSGRSWRRGRAGSRPTRTARSAGRPGPSGSTIAGILLFGLIARNSGLNWSPAPMSTGIARYARPHSSSMMWTLWPFGVAHEYTSIIASHPSHDERVRPGARL